MNNSDDNIEVPLGGKNANGSDDDDGVTAPPAPPEKEQAVMPAPKDRDKEGFADEPATTKRASSAPSLFTTPSAVPWSQQLKYVLQKNVRLLLRRPVLLTVMLLSTGVSVIISSLLARPASSPTTWKFEDVPLTDCGTIPQEWGNNLPWEEANSIPLSYNDDWRDGMAVTILALGPMVLSLCSFLMVHSEFQTKMVGILRGLGLRESVYWVSWWIPLVVVAFGNAMIGAIVAKTLTIHVFQETYFFGMLASFFFLDIALIGGSFVMVALCGTSRAAAPWIILLMMVVTWVPMIMISVESYRPSWWDSVNGVGSSPVGLFWMNQNTTNQISYWDGPNMTDIMCDNPILTEEYGTTVKSDEERMSIEPDDFFVGCSFAAGYANQEWSNPSGSAGLVFSFLVPYFHFNSIWANFLGYTGMRDRRFKHEHASMCSEELARRSVNASAFDPSHGQTGTAYKQGSMFNVNSAYQQCDYTTWPAGCESTCPFGNATSFFCPGEGFSCAYAAGPSPTESPSVHDLLGYLTCVAIILGFLASWWAQVFPGGNGAPQKFYFCFLPNYWTGKKTESSDGDGETVDGVMIENLRKMYGDFAAVKGVSFKMERGEVTALLGHNGAGKTTASHMICGETAPTDGDVKVFGHSVTKDAYTVRRLVGVCKQDDYLYTNLSAKEHLQLFGGLRGVSPEDLPETVQHWLESVDLAVVQDQYSSGFSGGMKRRLSVACSTIGGAPLIILDEPTTGMDPVSRRFVWRHIDEIKEGRVVLLTTHAMEEADLLSDVVAIMKKGELAALGTPLQLKTEHGSALQFSVIVDPSDVTETEAAILKHFETYNEWVTVDAGEAGNITVGIEKIQEDGSPDGVDVDVMANFVAWLDGDESKVSEYGFSNSSLEEVFLKVTEHDDEEEDKFHDELDEVDVCCPNCRRPCLLRCLRGPCRCCCRPRPKLAEEENKSSGEEAKEDEEAGTDVDISTAVNVSNFKPDLSMKRQIITLLTYSFRRNWTGRGSIANYIIYGLFALGTMLAGFAQAVSAPNLPFVAIPVTFLSLLIVSLIAPVYTDRQFGLFYLQRTQGLLRSSYILGQILYVFVVQFAFCFVLLTLYYASAVFREPLICPCAFSSTCDDQCSLNFGWWSYGQPPWDEYPTSLRWWTDTFNGQEVLVNVSTTAGSYGLLFGAMIVFSLMIPGAVFMSSYLPGYKLALVLVVFIATVMGIVPLIYYAIISGQDEEEQLECIWQFCNVTTDAFNIDSVSTLGNEFLGCAAATKYAAEPELGSLCMPPVPSILPQFGLFQLISLTLMSELVFTSDTPGYVEEVLISALGGSDVKCTGNVCQFPFAHQLYGRNVGFMFLGAFLLMIAGLAFVVFFDFPEGWVLRVRITVLGFFGSIMRATQLGKGKRVPTTNTKLDEDAVNGGILNEVIEEQKTVTALIEPFLKKPTTDDTVEDGETIADGAAHLDHAAIPRGEVPPVLTYKLSKTYPPLGGMPPKVALSNLDIHVPKGQVLGLLGKNGAGKSTALKILSISHKATGGVALVAGYDVATEPLEVFERLGNCPQFDIIWAGQSVQYHLEFFASLKGLPRDKIQTICQAVASSVGLGKPEVYKRKAGALSGGMRRRLSIAMSLIGAPDVLLLDEPSTGLDPSTRNSIWGLVNSFATSERAVIITTHMMIEADTLCNRIAIVSRGNLKVIGTQQHLKDEFGSGYLLQLNLTKSDAANQESAMEFVRTRLHKDAVLQIKQAKTLHIALPRDVDLTKLFRALYSKEASEEGRINQFLLSQSSLEDVFLALGD